MHRKIVVTSALPYANGPIHIGHLVEYIQTDIWVRFQRLCGNECFYFCADDTHGTPVMISSRARGISAEQLIEEIHEEHKRDFAGFHIDFNNYYSTHSPENKELSETIFKRLKDVGSITKREVEQAYCEKCRMSLPDRYVRGECPRCGAVDQYGDSCEVCSATYQPTELVEPYCATCGSRPVRRESVHYFFKLADYEDRLKELISRGYVQKSVSNKLDEWFKAGLRDWDISRDGPYFGFKIPGEENKYFYVWLDAPIGYMASAKNYCDANGLDFDVVWNSEEYELYHFIGKDIMYFHALFWPAMLMGSGFKPADKLFVHGFLTVNSEKMSKSRGTFIKADTYLKHLDPEFLRYYYASKLSGDVGDIDLSIEDFINKTNADIVGNFANLASRSVPMLNKKLDGKLGKLDPNGRQLVDGLASEKEQIMQSYERLDFGGVLRRVTALADRANRYIEEKQPWVTIKSDARQTRATLSAVINAVRILSIYLKPILPRFADKVQRILNVQRLEFADIEQHIENHETGKYVRLAERIDRNQVDAMIQESKETQSGQTGPSEPIAPECTIEDFQKIDLRIATVVKAEAVEGADKLLRLTLDVGGLEKQVLAGIAEAYNVEDLVDKTVVYLANLKPRKMKFGVSEGMILAAGTGGKDIFMLTADAGATPGQRVS